MYEKARIVNVFM